LAQGLFHKGIVQSAYGVISNPRIRALDAGIRLARAVGLNGADATLEELRSVSAETIGRVPDPLASLSPSFVVGDPVLPEPIADVFRDGREKPLPLIIGSNSDEASVTSAFGLDPALLFKNIKGMKWVLDLLYWGTDNDSSLARQVLRDLFFTSFAKRIADWHVNRAPTWRYYFSYVPVYLRETKTGVGHGDEIVFVMDTMDYVPSCNQFTSEDRQMARRVGSYWIEFVRTSVPDPAGEPHWPQMTSRKDRLLEFGETIRVRKNFMKWRLDFYNFLIRILDWYVRR
jgi:para-nitrobenzyl esterase